MASHYWIKLYQEILIDPKVGRLSDSAFRRFVEFMLMAGERDERDGFLPDFDDVAWTLRISREQLDRDFSELERAGIASVVDGLPFLLNFKSRQSALTPAEKQKRYRERKRKLSNNNSLVAEPVTKSNTDKTRQEQTRQEQTRQVSHAQDTPQSYRNFEKLHEVKTPLVEELEQAIKKCVLDSTSLEKINDTAYIAIANDVTPEDILKGFKGKNSYWFTVRYGKDGQKPWCKNIQQEMVAAKEWKPKANGIAPKEKYEPVMEVGYEL